MGFSAVISIIIPVYNRQELVRETLDSIFEQTYQEWECIVIDDGSTDNTWDTLQEYASKDHRFKIFKRHREPKGAPTCRNIGIDLAKGSYLMFMDSDDLMGKHCLIFRYEQSIKHQECDALIFDTSIFRFKIGDDKRIWNILINEKKDLNRFLNMDMPWSISGPLWKRKRIIKFDEEALSYQDWEFHIRFLLRREKYKKIESEDKESQVFCRRVGTYNSISNSQNHSIHYNNKVNIFQKIAKLIFLNSKNEREQKETEKLLLRTAIDLKRNKKTKEALKTWKVVRNSQELRKISYWIWWLYILSYTKMTKKIVEYLAYRVFNQEDMLNKRSTHLFDKFDCV